MTIYFPPDLVKRVKHACVDLDMTLSDFVRSAVEEYLKALETTISEKK
ncbi:MAG: CopG family transcriptional regulator [Thermodesulfobacterium geofontis]|uniref:CopG family transcriptional regulator n=1 Tax=Thermodesulfobacterium geofontis TaxID=1295609 RepID=A0A2N7QEX8_9BACT|nr:MAG: CopG family transcriptional regulator [Thermodesulfobacterium geofontis]